MISAVIPFLNKPLSGEYTKPTRGNKDIETFYDRQKNGIDFESLNIDRWALIQGVAFVMLLAGRIGSRIIQDAKRLKMTRKDLVSLMKFLKLIDTGKYVTIHNRKKSHTEMTGLLRLPLNNIIRCLGKLLLIPLALVVLYSCVIVLQYSLTRYCRCSNLTLTNKEILMGQRAYYYCSITDFLKEDEQDVLGLILCNDEFNTTDLQKEAWGSEIHILKSQLAGFSQGDIIFEYTIPRMGHRVDVICIIEGIVFLMEFKVGAAEYRKSTTDQVMDYALDLKYFHAQSRNRYIVPINVSTEAAKKQNAYYCMADKIFNPLFCNRNNIGITIQETITSINETNLNIDSALLSAKDWINSKYAPTPTIIEAAQALYRNHHVEEIARNDAGATNLTITTKAISSIIDQCKNNSKKAICFVTGVPGAGKTLAGLNIANERQHFNDDEHAVFLSGNGPLVDVLQNALAKDRVKREGISMGRALREAKAFIQNIHKFRDEALTTNMAPVEKVAIFDEAQRAWNKSALANFMKLKKGISDFNQSEPDFLINIMDRHSDWAVIVCLVGGGQEINNGEAGIQDWFEALAHNYPDWKIFLSDQITDKEYVGESDLSTLLNRREYHCVSDLHLGVSLRSFRSEKLALFVKLLLDDRADDAKNIFANLKQSYPIFLTRDFEIAKKWVKYKARGTERYGLLASSEGKRLRAKGIWVPSDINHVGWFLDGKDNINSSYYLEVAASEFKVQGLEIDYAIIAWDADFRYTSEGFDYFKFRGAMWNHVNQEQRQKYLKNAYRVLLTRARQGLIIYVPEGSDEDPSRNREFYDRTFQYLKSTGIEEANGDFLKGTNCSLNVTT